MTKTGRPTKYTQELADEICEHLAIGESIRTVCLPEHMPAVSTFFKWLREHEEFSKQYARAKQESADAMAEDILDIADNGTNDWYERENKDGSTSEVVNTDVIARSRLRVDTRKWLMAKMKPKTYGDKLEVDAKVENVTPILGGNAKENITEGISSILSDAANAQKDEPA
jgi:hypothetical protein